jgi:hypothetical protein
MGFHVWVWIGLFRPHRSGTLNYKMTNAFCLFVATHLSQGDITQSNSVRIPSGAQYVSDPAHFNWMKERQNMPVCLHKMVLAQHNCTSS